MIVSHHMNSFDRSEERIGVDGFGKFGEELAQLDKVQLEKLLLEKGENAERGAEEKFVAVAKEDVPHAASNVERKGL